jgi:hypothetical protein
MSNYEIKIDPHAFDRIRHLIDNAPDDVLESYKEELAKLQESPTTLSRPAPIPLWVGHQMFECFITHWPHRYRFMTYFKYSQDETALLVESIGLVVYDME